jgi:hypothetical protein
MPPVRVWFDFNDLAIEEDGANVVLPEHADGDLAPGTAILARDHDGNSMTGTVRRLTAGPAGAPLALVDLDYDSWQAGAAP